MTDTASSPGRPAPIVIDGPEQNLVDTRLPDGGLPPLPGVQSWCVFRATKDAVQLADGRGWTYHHHVDMAVWRGRLYVAWNSCEKDEDTWPSHELLSSSLDGVTWAPPVELFPQGVSTPLRMYFFHAPAGRMLAIAGLRKGTDELSEATKEGLVVREIHEDHTLGPVYLLQPANGFDSPLPLYSTAGDETFVTACRQLLADTVFLEQQDLGRLLSDRRMKWHDASAWPEGVVPGDDAKWVCGKGYSFFRQASGQLVGISKMGFTTCSADDGKTWTQPVIPPTLITGKAKVWSQRTADGRYALVYNPSRRTRYPLVAVSGEDGHRFRGMRVVHGEIPVQRYEGRARSVGPQYVRGVSVWSNDGSRADERAMWIVYSVNKEDIWVSRLPLPIGVNAGETWNTYCPKWSVITRDGAGLTLQNRDPYDYPIVTRVLEPLQQATIGFEITLPARQRNADVEVDLVGSAGSPRPIRLRFDRKGEITLTEANGQAMVGLLNLRGWTRVSLAVNARAGTFDLSLAGRTVRRGTPFAERSGDIGQIVFRLGPYRGIGGLKPVPPGSDVPGPLACVKIRNVTVTPVTTRTPSGTGYQSVSQ